MSFLSFLYIYEIFFCQLFTLLFTFTITLFLRIKEFMQNKT